VLAASLCYARITPAPLHRGEYGQRRGKGDEALGCNPKFELSHYGVFSGRRWNNEIYPLLRDFVHVNS
jgi:hypothetical protein